MSIFEALRVIQDARAQVEVWGVSGDTLLWAAAVATLVFAWSLREVLGWYLRLGEIRRDLREIKALLAPRAAPAPLEAPVADSFDGPERF